MFREARSLAQGHTADNWQSLDSSLISLVPESTVLSRQHPYASSPEKGTIHSRGEMLDFQVSAGEGGSREALSCAQGNSPRGSSC